MKHLVNTDWLTPVLFQSAMAVVAVSTHRGTPKVQAASAIFVLCKLQQTRRTD